MKKYKISCENAEVKAEAIKLFEALGYSNWDTGDKHLCLAAHADGDIQSITNKCLTDDDSAGFKQITIEKLRKMAKPTDCLVKTDNGWEYKVLPKSLIGDAIKIPKKANFAVLNNRGAVVFYESKGSVRCKTEVLGNKWFPYGRGVAGRTPIWQRTEKSKFIVKTKFGYEVQELPKETPVTWHCIPLVDGVYESDQVAFYELCDKVEAVDLGGVKWMRENIENCSHDLLECFVFKSTPQGIHYWNLVNKLIK